MDGDHSAGFAGDRQAGLAVIAVGRGEGRASPGRRWKAAGMEMAGLEAGDREAAPQACAPFNGDVGTDDNYCFAPVHSS